VAEPRGIDHLLSAFRTVPMVGITKERLTIYRGRRVCLWTVLNFENGDPLVRVVAALFLRTRARMISIGGWLATIAPFAALRSREAMPGSLPMASGMPSHMTSKAPHARSSICDYSHEFAAENRPADDFPVASHPSQVASDDDLPLEPTGVRLDDLREGILVFERDPSLPVPSTVEASVEAFMDLLREASERGYIEGNKITIANLSRMHSELAAEAGWPAATTNRLSSLMEKNGFKRDAIRERKSGKDKKTVAFVITPRRGS
jgi:hypothetical protein